ncbi:MAG: DMT family transporter [Rhodospirillales bacterium]|nr:DMT family transporter [Rhodospirillales bacterium]
MTPSKTRAPALMASLWMAGTLVSFMIMAISGRELSQELSTFEILFFRSLIGLAIISVILSKTGWGQVRTARPILQITRNLAHYVGQFGWFYGISLLPLAQVFALEFTIPIWVACLAPFLLGERVTAVRVATIAIGFTGTLIILRPGMVPVSLASLAVLMAAGGYALAYIMTKLLSRTDPPITILFYMTVVQLPLGLVPSLFDWVTPSPALWPWLGVVGVTALTAHYCLTRAFVLADALVVIPLDFLRLPLAALIGFVFYNETLDVFVLIGAVIIFGGNFLGILRDAKAG